jgi:hypothetical protein
MNGWVPRSLLYAVACNSSGRFIAVGNTTDNQPSWHRSDDSGVTWTDPQFFNGFTDTGYMYGIACNAAGRFVAVGKTTGDLGRFSYSDDGSTWTTPASFGGYPYYFCVEAITVNSAGLFVAVGAAGTTTLRVAYAFSTDGATWTQPAVIGDTDNVLFNAVVNLPGGWFAAGGGDATSMLTARYHQGVG